jgi:hypothetical protein
MNLKELLDFVDTLWIIFISTMTVVLSLFDIVLIWSIYEGLKMKHWVWEINPTPALFIAGISFITTILCWKYLYEKVSE